MNAYRYPLLDPPPPVSDEAAVAILDFVCAFLEQFEAAYYSQIRRYHNPAADDLDPNQLELFSNSHSPPF